MKKVLIITIMSLLVAVHAKDNRSEKDFGIYLSGYDPMPASVGFHLAGNMFSFLRISGGIGTYNNGGNFFEESMESITAGFLYVATLGLFDYSDIREFVDTDDKVTPQYIFSYSAGVNLFVPGCNLSPTVGFQVGRYSSKNNPFGLRDKQSYVSYRAGLEWQSSAGFMVGVGIVHTPVLPEELKTKIYAQIGWFM